jgi:hypothetical protein
MSNIRSSHQRAYPYLRTSRLYGFTKIFLGVAALFLAVSASFASATNVYVAQNAAGAASGADCADAVALSWFNSSANWGSGPTQIGPGTTVHLCGTFTASAGADSYLQMQASGSSGNPITIKWETGAIVQAPYFSSAHGGIDINGQSWLVIDGGSNGIIQNTANGTGLTYQQTSTLIGSWSGSSNDIVKNLSMSNIYVHTNGDANGSAADGILARHASNLTIGPNNTVAQADVGIMFEWDGGESNLVITGNHFNGVNQDIQMGPTTTSAVMTNVSVYGNDATNWVNWDEPGNGYHHNFFHPFTNVSGASLTGTLQIYNNSSRGDMGNHATSMIFIENNNGGSGGTMGSWYIFNNLFDKTNNNAPSSSGIVAVMSASGKFYNNTIRDAGGTGANAYTSLHFYSGATGWTMTGNIFQGGAYMVYDESSSVTGNDNVYYNSPSGTPWIWGSTFISAISTWRSDCSCDAAAVTTNPNLNSDMTLASGSSAISLGANLTSLGITQLNSDKAGMARPSSGAWDSGAYRATSGSASATNAPANLIAVVL